MNISHFIAGTWQTGYQYQYFLPEKINHSFFWTDEGINELLEKASLKLGELNSFSRFNLLKGFSPSDVFITQDKLYNAIYKGAK